jgi:hypothetical protein
VAAEEPLRAGTPGALTRPTVGVSIGAWKMQTRQSEKKHTHIEVPQCGCVFILAPEAGHVEKEVWGQQTIG